jgi:hypothetical protein
VPSKYSAGWNLLSESEQLKANEIALVYLNKWLESKGMNPVEMDEATSAGRQVNIY